MFFKALSTFLLIVMMQFLINFFSKKPPFPTPLPRHHSKATIVTWPKPNIDDAHCYNAPSMAKQYMDEGMPYPDYWTINLVCSEGDWQDLLIQEDLSCALSKHCTNTAFTVIPMPPGKATKSALLPFNTYLRAHNFLWNDHVGGARHTMLHELGHVFVGWDENTAERWATEWEYEYGTD